MPLALILAFAASLGVHALALFGTDVDLSFPPEPVPLTAELRPVQKAVARPMPSAPALETHARRKGGGSRRVTVAGPADAGRMPATPGTAEMPSPPASENTGENESVAQAVAPTIPDFPERGQIRYRVDRGDDGFEIGLAVSEWEIVDGAYTLRLQTETTGLVWLFKRYRIDMESRGRLTAEGLVPERFSLRRNGADSGEGAVFDWQRMLVSVAGKEAQPLSPGAQDLLSFNFHLGFMLNPRVARALPIATGRKYADYALEAVGDEEIELPLGTVRTLHLRAPGANMTELWLAYDYLLLPVKIRHEDSKGGSFVQLATGISLGPTGDE